MKEPILIIHGVNNHDYAPFAKQVDRIQQVLGQAKKLIPVYWGDKGGQSVDLGDCLPAFSEGEWKVRADDDTTLVLSRRAARTVFGPRGVLDNALRAEAVSSYVRQASLVRGAPDVWQEQVRDAVANALGTSQVLQYIDDRETLAIIGRTIDAVLRDQPAGESTQLPGDYAVRGDEDATGGIDTRGWSARVKQITSDVMQGIDEALGRVIGNHLGRLNQSVRARLAIPISGTLGDIMSYQRQPDRIQDTLREALEKYAPDYGREAQPISVIAHSLGGVVAFDAAVKPISESKRLWIKSFVTFGSQAAFFHIVDPRLPNLKTYRRDAPVALPRSIAQWTNLWDPMDLLAFTAGTVFRLADGSPPVDISVNDSASELIAEKGWAHSVYWESDELFQALRTALS